MVTLCNYTVQLHLQKVAKWLIIQASAVFRLFVQVITVSHHLIIYTREGCHLCEQMAAALYVLQKEVAFQMSFVDIDDNPEWLTRYNADVPVVTLNNKVLFRHFFDEDKLRQALTDG